MECLSYCIANSIDLTRLDNYYKTTAIGYISTKYRDVLKLVPIKSADIMVFIFKNGTVVSWGLKRHQVTNYLDTIKSYADKPIAFKVHDEVSYQFGSKTAIEPHDYFDVDCLTLDRDSDNYELKLSLSYGFSQSVKLQYFETILEGLIERNTPLIHNLAKKSTGAVSRHQVRHVTSEILRARTELNLISNFLYHPKYFWQHPTLEEYYIMLERYLHIQRRVNAMNHRLDILNDIFDMFNDYLDNRHAHNLELIIIGLIAIEIVVSLLKFHF
jgi:uncharacterized Rmd1/YagE family protein